MERNVILSLYKELGHDGLEAIVQVTQLPLKDVRAILYEHCPEFRQRDECMKPVSNENAEAVVSEMLTIMMGLARHSESDNVKLAAAKTIIDEYKGRNDGPRQSAGLPANFTSKVAQARSSIALRYVDTPRGN